VGLQNKATDNARDGVHPFISLDKDAIINMLPNFKNNGIHAYGIPWLKPYHTYTLPI